MFHSKNNSNKLKIISQTFAQAWSAFLQLISIPIYILLLGTESYGLLGIISSIEAIMVIIDTTLSSSLTREISRKLVSTSRENVKNLIIIVGKYYFLIIFLLTLVFFLISYLLFMDALSKNNGDYNILYLSTLTALLIFARLSISFAKSILIGDQKQITLSINQSIFITLRIVGSVILVYFFSNNLAIFLIWHLVILFLEFLALTIFINIIFNNRKIKNVNYKYLIKDILSFAPNMFILALTSLIITQSDRVLISLNFDLLILGEYNYFKNLVLGMFVLTGGIHAYLYPTISSLFIYKNWNKISLNCEIISRVVTWAAFPFGIALFFLGDNIFLYFINNKVDFNYKDEVFIILILGTILNLLCMVPWLVLLASGYTNILVIINFIFVPITLLFTWFGFEYYDILSWPIIYLIYNLFALIVSSFSINTYFPELNFLKLYFGSIYKPSIIGLIFFILYISIISELYLILQSTIIFIYILFSLFFSFKSFKNL